MKDNPTVYLLVEDTVVIGVFMELGDAKRELKDREDHFAAMGFPPPPDFFEIEAWKVT